MFLLHKKNHLFYPELALFWALLFVGILISSLTFIYLSLLWFISICAIFFLLIWKAFILGKSFINLRREKEYEKASFLKLIENANDAIIIYDKNFKILMWNSMAEDIFKIRKEEALGMTISPEKISDASLKVLIQSFFPSLAPSISKKSAHGEYPQIIDMSFPEPALELTISTDRVLDVDNTPIGFLKIIKNRTREVSLIRAKSEFITIAAHQLRTPLTAVHWIFETLAKKELLPTEDKELIISGLTSSAKLVKTVNDLLDVSKIESGQFGYIFTEIDIGTFIDDLLKNANVLAKKYKVSLYFNRPQAPIMIYGDLQKLSIAFSNIIDNAIKYNVQNGQVIVKIEPYPNRPYIQITIQDTGIGIPKDVMTKIFTKFFRGDNVLKEQTEGSGLGLYIAKNIIIRHGGNISADSTLGRGSLFYVVLPTDPTLIPPKEVTIES